MGWKLENKILNLPTALENEMHQRVMKRQQEKEDAENIQLGNIKQKFQFKSERIKQAKLNQLPKEFEPVVELTLQQIHDRIYSKRAEFNRILIYEDAHHWLTPQKLVLVIIDQINMDIRERKKQHRMEVEAKKVKISAACSTNKYENVNIQELLNQN